MATLQGQGLILIVKKETLMLPELTSCILGGRDLYCFQMWTWQVFTKV